MTFEVIRKDFIPTYTIDDNGFEHRFYQSYSGREFESITGYLISREGFKCWARQEDIFDLKPDVDLSLIEDRTQEKLSNIWRIQYIYQDMLEYEPKETVIERIKKHTQDEFIAEYMEDNDYIRF